MTNQDASIKNLENQVGQLANFLARRSPKSLPSNAKKNPREELKAITIKSGKAIELKSGKEKEA